MVKLVGTWRNTADFSTKIPGKKRIKVLLNLMGYADTHNDYYPVGVQERLEEEQKELEKKAVRGGSNKQMLKEPTRLFGFCYCSASTA